jgi:hypothetical protein
LREENISICSLKPKEKTEMIHTYFIQEVARQKQEEILQLLKQEHMLREAYPQVQKRRLPDLGQVFARLPRLYCRLSAWVMGIGQGA